MSDFFNARIVTTTWNVAKRLYIIGRDAYDNDADGGGGGGVERVLFQCIRRGVRNHKQWKRFFSFVPHAKFHASLPVPFPSLNTIFRFHGLPDLPCDDDDDETIAAMAIAGLRQYQKDNGALIKWSNIVLEYNNREHNRPTSYRVNTDMVPGSLCVEFLGSSHRLTVDIGVFEWPARRYYWLTQPKLKAAYVCRKTDTCRHQSRDLSTLTRHEETCSDESIIKSRAKMYGCPRHTYQKLFDLDILPRDALDAMPRCFSVFDLETLDAVAPPDDVPADFDVDSVVELKLVSIAAAHNIPLDQHDDLGDGYFQRKCSHPDSAQALVDEFLSYLIELGKRRIALLPQAIRDALEKLETFTPQTPAEKRFDTIHKASCILALKRMYTLSCFGFNSGRFDIKILLPYIAHYARVRNLPPPRILKRGTSYFSVELENIVFKGKRAIIICIYIYIYNFFV